jgi:hypothetical protein
MPMKVDKIDPVIRVNKEYLVAFAFTAYVGNFSKVAIFDGPKYQISALKVTSYSLRVTDFPHT